MSGTLVARFAFDPWGRRTVVTGDGATTVGYAGHQWNESGGLWNTLYRPYDPALGRWLSEDPSGVSGGINLFAYVENGPVVNIDPLGLQLYVPGPPPIKMTPSGCSAGQWQFVDHGDRSTYRPKWAKTNSWGINIARPRPGARGQNSAPLLGMCFCQWTRVGTIKVTTLSELWKRKITCCNNQSDEYETTEKTSDHQVPSIGPPGVTAVTAGQFWGGQCNCFPPS